MTVWVCSSKIHSIPHSIFPLHKARTGGAALPTRWLCMQHGMLTQDGQEEELCDEAVEDLVGDSSSLLGSQVQIEA